MGAVLSKVAHAVIESPGWSLCSYAVDQSQGFDSVGATHACTLGAMAVDARRVEITGETYTRVGYGDGSYYSLAGPVKIPRALYRRLGDGNAPVVDAISLRAGVIGDGWLPRTGRAMAHGLQNGTSREAAQSAKETGRLPYSRASFERVPHEVGKLYVEHRADIEDRLMQELEVPDAARSVSVSLDRASVPMEEPIQRPPGRPRKDAPKIKRVFHMAYCGTVTLHDAEGEALYTLRFGQMPALDAGDLCNAMATTVYRLREKRSELALMLLADGAHEMWNLLEPCFPTEVFGARERLVDFFHVVEKLSPAAATIHGADQAAGVLKGSPDQIRSRRMRFLAERLRHDAARIEGQNLAFSPGKAAAPPPPAQELRRAPPSHRPPQHRPRKGAADADGEGATGERKPHDGGLGTSDLVRRPR